VLNHSIEQLTKVQNTSSNPSQTYDELHLLQSLAAEWQQPRRRRHQRLPIQEVIELISTVPAIWYRSNGMSWVQNGNEEAAPPPTTRAPPPPSLFVVVNQCHRLSAARPAARPDPARRRGGLLTQPGKPTAPSCAWCAGYPAAGWRGCGMRGGNHRSQKASW
jgi:hypothetical protein